MIEKKKGRLYDLNVLYFTPFYTGNCFDMYARMHDLWHYMNREGNEYFNFKILAASGDHIDSKNVYVPFKVLNDYVYKLSRSEYHSKTYKELIQKTVVGKILMEDDYDIFHPIHFDDYGLELIKLVKKKKGDDVKVVLGPNVLGYLEGRKGELFDLNKVGDYRAHQYKKEYTLKKKYLKSEYIDGIWVFGKYHEKLLHKCGVPKEKMFLLPPAVDPKYFSNKWKKKDGKNNIFRILYLGDFTKFKGIDVFLKALELLKKQTDIQFEGILVGKGSYPIERHTYIKDNIRIVGLVDRSIVNQYYNKADVYVHPSVDEVGAGTMIESLACGTPVIATDRLGFREYDTQNVCKFFNIRNSIDLKDKLIEFYGEKSSKTHHIKSDIYTYNQETLRVISKYYKKLMGE